MDKKEQILHYHRIDGLSLREIARKTGLNRKTVTRYIREYETLAQADPEEGVDMCLASKPKYTVRKAERTKLTDAVCAEIEYWIEEDGQKKIDIAWSELSSDEEALIIATIDKHWDELNQMIDDVSAGKKALSRIFSVKDLLKV